MNTKRAVALGACFATLWVQYEQGMRPSIPKALQTLTVVSSATNTGFVIDAVMGKEYRAAVPGAVRVTSTIP
jgi:polyisoprenoid-binding protein YceI